MRLKRLLISFLTIFFLGSTVMAAAAAPTVQLNGKQLLFDVAPSIEDGTTLVPLRAIFEAMGATVAWYQDTQTVTAVKGNTTVVLQIGSTTPTINGQIKQMDVPAQIVNERTLAPLGFVEKAFDATVSWDPTSEVISISTGISSSQQVNAGLQTATVIRAAYGDTIVANMAGQEKEIRLILVDTPELVDPDPRKNAEYGKLTSEFTGTLLKPGQTIYLQKDVSETDKNGRMLRYVWLAQPADVESESEVRAKMYNAKMLLGGYAQLAAYPPDVKYADMFLKFQQEAREDGWGMWRYEQNL